jgi:poly(hydroxyalkanoate) depolymerase family esterase
MLIVELMILAAFTVAAAPLVVQADTTGGGQFIEKQFTSAHGTRAYKLYVPAAREGARPRPLVVMLHGCTQDAADFAAGTRMNDLADEKGFLVLYPEQPPSAHPQECWNWYEPAHQTRGAGEPAILAGMAREVIHEYQLDERRVYVAGVSAGGIMGITLAVTYPDLFTAVASHSGVGYGVARTVNDALAAMRTGSPTTGERARATFDAMGEHARAVPAILFHGAADPVVSRVNADELMAQWSTVLALADGSLTAPESVDERVEKGEYSYTRTMRRLHPGGPVVLESWVIDGLGHAWSGGSPAGTYTDAKGPDASREMIRFLLQHEKD